MGIQDRGGIPLRRPAVALHRHRRAHNCRHPHRSEVGGSPPLRRTLSGAEAEVEGWFRGPPYAGAESAFDEDDIEGCAPGPGEENA